MVKPVVVVVGAGPGVSGSVARLFAGKGYDVGLVGVQEPALAELRETIPDADVHTVVADLTDSEAATLAIRNLGDHFRRIDVLHFNPSAFRQKHPLTLTSEELLQDVGLGVGALLTALQAVRPYMSAGGRVTATGSMAADKPWNEAASLGIQKAGLRNLVHSIDATLEPDGIRATSLTVRGTLGKDGPFTPDRVADAIFDAAHQDEGEWRTEVPYTG